MGMDLMAVAAFLDEINELLEAERYSWAETTLRGIADTVRRSRTVSAEQRTAVSNIRQSIREPIGLPSNRYRSSRRYEGYAPSYGRRGQ